MGDHLPGDSYVAWASIADRSRPQFPDDDLFDPTRERLRCPIDLGHVGGEGV
ncbi:MAG: hypothetical protein QOE59_5060, partial [Actinomycetota bacterium]|nr:hypothetical protein [Actinomycetota bacterium]